VTEESASTLLVISGVLLLLLGLLNGALVNVLLNPRMGLSAHLAGVQNGMVLILFGLVWGRAQFSSFSSVANVSLAVYSMYGFWIALLLSAMWGTSASTPIAGKGFSGQAWQEAAVGALLMSSSLAITVACGWLLTKLTLRFLADS
jgi:hydroxylaminobenzene mutase